MQKIFIFDESQRGTMSTIHTAADPFYSEMEKTIDAWKTNLRASVVGLRSCKVQERGMCSDAYTTHLIPLRSSQFFLNWKPEIVEAVADRVAKHISSTSRRRWKENDGRHLIELLGGTLIDVPAGQYWVEKMDDRFKIGLSSTNLCAACRALGVLFLFLEYGTSNAGIASDRYDRHDPAIQWRSVVDVYVTCSFADILMKKITLSPRRNC